MWYILPVGDILMRIGKENICWYPSISKKIYILEILEYDGKNKSLLMSLNLQKNCCVKQCLMFTNIDKVKKLGGFTLTGIGRLTIPRRIWHCQRNCQIHVISDFYFSFHSSTQIYPDTYTTRTNWLKMSVRDWKEAECSNLICSDFHLL